jgi:hypothetical protein
MLKDSDQLKDRVEARKHELLAKYNTLKADTRAEAAATRDKLKKKLDEVEDYVKEGWDAAKVKLDKWLQTDD